MYTLLAKFTTFLAFYLKKKNVFDHCENSVKWYRTVIDLKKRSFTMTLKSWCSIIHSN